MALLHWTDDLSVHHTGMDEQHKRLFDLAGRLWASAEDEGADAARLIEGIVEYTHSHFASEEAMLAAIAYPALKGHKQRHKSIFEAVDTIINRLAGSDPKILVREVAEFVSEWLVRHIQTEDMQYGRFIIGQSALPAPKPDCERQRPLARMRDLKQALDEGLISPEEFERKKKALIEEF